MADTPKIIPTTKMDYESYTETLKNFLRTQYQFNDYDFEGTNISVLISLLARNTYYNSLNYNMVGSEMWLDSAQIRSSVVSHAKELNYVPRSRGSAKCFVNIEIVPNTAPPSITIPRYYKFRTTNTNGKTVFFVTDQEYIAVRNVDGRYIFSNVELYEGDIVYEYFTVNAVETKDDYVVYNQTFNIQSENIDISSLEVYVSETNGSASVRYTRANNLYGLDENSQIFFVEGYADNHYALVFGDGILGKALSNNNLITVRFRNTQGAEIRGSYVFNKTVDISGFTDITVTTISRVEGGSEREATESIQYNAPRFFQTQERAVIDTDYETLIRANFPTIQQVNVYGGDEVYQYGKIMIVLKPFGVNGLVSSQTKRQIIAFLKPKNIVPQIIILDPDYYYLGIKGNVYYRDSVTNVIQDTVETTIKNKLQETNNDILGDFNSTVYQSIINEIIKSSDNRISGSDITLSMYKLWNPPLGVKTTLSFTTDNAILKPDTSYITGNKYSVITSVFQTIYNGSITSAVIQDDGVGKMYMHIVDLSGNKTKIVDPVGTIDYTLGNVNITMDVYSYTGRAITFQCTLAGDSVEMARDKFISVDPLYVDLNIIGNK